MFLFLFSFFIFAFGACIGSFLNVCIWRIPRGKSLFYPPSSCPNCSHKIKFYENIPIFSWIFLKGKCSSCGKKISIRYPLVEFLCAFFYLMIWIKVFFLSEHLLRLLPLFAITALAISTFFIDMEHYIIPDLTTYPVIFIGLGLSIIFPESYGFKNVSNSFIFSFSGFIIALIFMAAFSIIGKDALGWGDVKYLAAVGACLGFPGAFFCVLFASLIASLFGIFLIFWRKKQITSVIPFGPFLSIGTILWIFLDKKLIMWYLNFLNYLRNF